MWRISFTAIVVLLLVLQSFGQLNRFSLSTFVGSGMAYHKITDHKEMLPEGTLAFDYPNGVWRRQLELGFQFTREINENYCMVLGMRMSGSSIFIDMSYPQSMGVYDHQSGMRRNEEFWNDNAQMEVWYNYNTAFLGIGRSIYRKKNRMLSVGSNVHFGSFFLNQNMRDKPLPNDYYDRMESTLNSSESIYQESLAVYSSSFSFNQQRIWTWSIEPNVRLQFGRDKRIAIFLELSCLVTDSRRLEFISETNERESFWVEYYDSYAAAFRMTPILISTKFGITFNLIKSKNVAD